MHGRARCLYHLGMTRDDLIGFTVGLVIGAVVVTYGVRKYLWR